MRTPCAALLILGLALACTSFAEPDELAAARSRYRQESDIALGPARERYLAALDQLKKSAGLLQDRKAAAAIEEETQRVKQGSLLWRMVGIWTINYPNKVVRTYVILPDATAIWTSENGHALNKKTRLVADGPAFFIEWDDGKLERVLLNGEKMRVEHYFPKSKFTEGAPPFVGEGTFTPFK